ncbi:AAA family ATPase [Corynebacterium lizhenjunii]|uniref:AAA family ATPase n=1 Tax=Corynebacterium lizhenjunii TaxID=2709394 RepID=A0A7T0KEG9_9CORY|nr:AAA family ATPase [Corynebacterium lizhenjunii]QPK79311.1 AAA family ATPase [Corynebacterium lizhenjunii]
MFLSSARLERVEPDWPDYLANLPAVQSLVRQPLRFTQSVTVLVGDNGAGKSTLVEAIAVGMGFNPEGGSRHTRFETYALSDQDRSVSPLHYHLVLARRANPRDGFFLRGESYLELADYLQALGPGPNPNSRLDRLGQYSHGQGLMLLLEQRFHAGGLFILDEPEDGLTVANQRIAAEYLAQLAGAGSQIILATHSPVFMAIPGAQLLEISAAGIQPTALEATEAMSAAREWAADPLGTAYFLTHPEVD